MFKRSDKGNPADALCHPLTFPSTFSSLHLPLLLSSFYARQALSLQVLMFCCCGFNTSRPVFSLHHRQILILDTSSSPSPPHIRDKMVLISHYAIIFAFGLANPTHRFEVYLMNCDMADLVLEKTILTCSYITFNEPTD